MLIKGAYTEETVYMKSIELIARPLRGGGGVKGRAIKEKRTFFGTFFSNVPTAIKLEGGALMARPLREELFLRLP